MENNEVIEILKTTLINNNIDNIDEILKKFDIYYKYLVEYNQNVNLTAITTFEDVYIKHFVDCIENVKLYKHNSTLCDIGTGAGFPGLVIKIVRPDIEVTLVDSLNKRIVFLNNLIQMLNLENINCLHYRAEDTEFKNKYLNSFDYVVARAVANMSTLTEYCLPYVKIGGEFIAYKSNDIENEVLEAKKCIAKLGGTMDEILSYKTANLYERKIIIVKKQTKTSIIYPRGQNKPRLKPIK